MASFHNLLTFQGVCHDNTYSLTVLSFFPLMLVSYIPHVWNQEHIRFNTRILHCATPRTGLSPAKIPSAVSGSTRVALVYQPLAV